MLNTNINFKPKQINIMTKEDYINNIMDLPLEEIASGIRKGKVSFEDLQKTGDFREDRQRQVRKLLEGFKQEDDDFNSANSISELNEFLTNYPNSSYLERVEKKIRKIQKEEDEEMKRKFEEIKGNINDYKPDELKHSLSDEMIRELCNELGIGFNIVSNYREPKLTFNDVPSKLDEIPKGFTDVFFWGIPSSGKTTALSAILRTMDDKYTITSPKIKVKFGSNYKNSLINIFNKKSGFGYLPPSTQKDRTQYIPLLLKKRKEKKYRQISFFELSGEVFKYFYELESNAKIMSDASRHEVTKAFETLDLILRSDNQKIHFFFIDYKKETSGFLDDNNNLTQSNYLDAAATYFRDNNNIFKRKTDAVYVILTKADEIKEENKIKHAGNFLDENFGGFMDVLKNRCKEDSVEFKVKIFSIGEVYLKGICKLDYKYSDSVINDLLHKVKPTGESWLGKILRS